MMRHSSIKLKMTKMMMVTTTMSLIVVMANGSQASKSMFSISSLRTSSSSSSSSLQNNNNILPFIHKPLGLTEPGAAGVDWVPFDRTWLAPSHGPIKLEDYDYAIRKLPRSLTAPDFVKVFEYSPNHYHHHLDDDVNKNDKIDDKQMDQVCVTTTTNQAVDIDPNNHNKNSMSLYELGRKARQILDEELPNCGAVLFRNLHYQIHTPEDFSEFWKGCYEYTNTNKNKNNKKKNKTKHQNANAASSWVPTVYLPFNANRQQTAGGVDLATNIPGKFVLGCHNEMSYNPKPNSRIAFYCFQPANIGGETLVARNVDITREIRTEIKNYVKSHGGIRVIRSYPDQSSAVMNDDKDGNIKNGNNNNNKNNDDNNNNNNGDVSKKNVPLKYPNLITWQEKCGTNNRKEAIKYFQRFGFKDIKFDDKTGAMTLNYTYSGFIPNMFLQQQQQQQQKPNNQDDNDLLFLDEEVWFNALDAGIPMISLGDGTQLSSEQMIALRADQSNAVKVFKLRRGDWLVLDNRMVQHGRLAFEEDPESPRTLLTVYTE